jgi:antitoxin FitA
MANNIAINAITAYSLHPESLGGGVASITIRNLEDPLKARLRVRAAHHGRSMEEEVRHILRTVLTEERQPPMHLGESIRRRFAPFGGVELPDVEREPLRDPPSFD